MPPLSPKQVSEYARRAVRKPFDFDYGGQYPLFKTWGLAPFFSHSHADEVQARTFDEIALALEQEFPGEVAVERFDHFLMKWMDRLLVRVYDERKRVTAVFVRMLEYLDRWNDVMRPQEPLPEPVPPEMDFPPQPPPEPPFEYEQWSPVEATEEEFRPEIQDPDTVLLHRIRSKSAFPLRNEAERAELAQALHEGFAENQVYIPVSTLLFILSDRRIVDTDFRNPKELKEARCFVFTEIQPYLRTQA